MKFEKDPQRSYNKHLGPRGPHKALELLNNGVEPNKFGHNSREAKNSTMTFYIEKGFAKKKENFRQKLIIELSYKVETEVK